MLPSLARLLDQTTPPPVTASVAPPVTGWLNSVNLSPTVSAGPGLLTQTVPVFVLLKVPLTTTRSFDGASDLLTLTDRFPPRVNPPLRVSVPIADGVPGASAVPGSTLTGPPIVVVPPSPPAETVTLPLNVLRSPVKITVPVPF